MPDLPRYGYLACFAVADGVDGQLPYHAEDVMGRVVRKHRPLRVKGDAESYAVHMRAQRPLYCRAKVLLVKGLAAQVPLMIVMQ